MHKLPETMTKVPRKRVTHGIQFWLRTGKINPSIRGYKKIQAYLISLEKQLIEETGGQANLTAAKEILLRSTIRCYGVVLLAELYVSRYSILRPDEAKRGVLVFQPVLERSYMNILGQIRQNLLALGLEKRAEPEMSLTEIIKQVDAENAERAVAEKAEREAAGQEDQGKETGDGEIASPERNAEDISDQGEES